VFVCVTVFLLFTAVFDIAGAAGAISVGDTQAGIVQAGDCFLIAILKLEVHVDAPKVISAASLVRSACMHKISIEQHRSAAWNVNFDPIGAHEPNTMVDGHHQPTKTITKLKIHVGVLLLMVFPHEN